MKTIVVAGNGPSAQDDKIGMLVPQPETTNALIFRTNYFFLPENDMLNHCVDGWFICEDVNDCRAVKAFVHGVEWGGETALVGATWRPTIWLPGIHMDKVDKIRDNHLAGFDIRVQKEANLPAACRWERDLVPYRPLMGSFAIAVAVGMQPDELILCGHDLFQHPSGNTHGSSSKETRDWQTQFNLEYIENHHRNHRLDGDLKYIGDALRAYRGQVTAVGSVLASYFRDEFPEWTWLEG